MQISTSASKSKAVFSIITSCTRFTGQYKILPWVIEWTYNILFWFANLEQALKLFTFTLFLLDIIICLGIIEQIKPLHVRNKISRKYLQSNIYIFIITFKCMKFFIITRHIRPFYYIAKKNVFWGIKRKDDEFLFCNKSLIIYIMLYILNAWSYLLSLL